VARVVVDVMLKPEILDPQGQAIARALPRLGFDGVLGVRAGKRFEVELDGPADEAALDRVREMAETLLANPVIETFSVWTAENTAEDTSDELGEEGPSEVGTAVDVRVVEVSAEPEDH
jgi:phosphoribosylformylglycinamidine synthase